MHRLTSFMICCIVSAFAAIFGYVSLLSAPGIEPGFGLSQPASELLVQCVGTAAVVVSFCSGVIANFIGLWMMMFPDQSKSRR